MHIDNQNMKIQCVSLGHYLPCFINKTRIRYRQYRHTSICTKYSISIQVTASQIDTIGPTRHMLSGFNIVGVCLVAAYPQNPSILGSPPLSDLLHWWWGVTEAGMIHRGVIMEICIETLLHTHRPKLLLSMIFLLFPIHLRFWTEWEHSLGQNPTFVR